MSDPCIICVAITGSLPTKANNPAVPISVSEQVEMGVKNAMPVDRDVFDFYIQTVQRLFGEKTPWCAAGIGEQQLTLNEWAVAAGGHARTGLEDNVRLNRSTLAPSNAALVQRVVNLCAQHDRPVATPAQARRILGLVASADGVDA